MSWFPIAIALVLGLAFGSFMTVAIDRVPAGESLVRPRSRCPSCGAPIRAADNIPVISWLMLRGRCRACGARIPLVYPLTELASGGLFVAVALVYEDPWRAVLLAPFAGLMVAISVIDLRHRRIPNRLIYPAFVIAAAVIIVGAARAARTASVFPAATRRFGMTSGVAVPAAAFAPATR